MESSRAVGAEQETVHPEAAGDGTTQRPAFWRLAVACGVGTSLEYFDFFVYGTATALVFGQLFFSASEPWLGTLLSFFTFTIGFIARPVGAAVFGHFGDRIGRRRMLVISLALMGVSTAGIGLLPTYAAIGVAAPLLLVVLRVLNGLSVGGEAGGAALLAVEHAPPGKRGLYGSLVTLGSPAGAFLANGSFALVVLLPTKDMLDWGWRIPFLAGVVVVFVGIFARRGIGETPAFAQVERAHATERVPLWAVLRKQGKTVALTAGVNLGFNSYIFILFIFILSYGDQKLHVPKSVMLIGTLVGCVTSVICTPLFSALTDRIGRKPVMLVGASACALYSFPLFWLVDTKDTGLIILAITLGFIASAATFGPMLTYFSELFEPELRYTGVGIGYQVGAVLGGGLSPVFAQLLVQATGASWSVSLYVMVGGLITIGCLLALPETVQRSAPKTGSASYPQAAP